MEQNEKQLSPNIDDFDVNVMSEGFDYNKYIETLSKEERERLLAYTKVLNPENLDSVVLYGPELKRIMTNRTTVLLYLMSTSSEHVKNFANLSETIIDLVNEVKFDENKNSKLSKLINCSEYLANLSDRLKWRLNMRILAKVNFLTNKLDLERNVALGYYATLGYWFEDTKQKLVYTRELVAALKLYLSEHQEQLGFGFNSNDFRDVVQKRLSDIQITEYDLVQTLRQIQTMRSEWRKIIDKSEDVISTIVPTWTASLVEAYQKRFKVENNSINK